MNPSPRTLEEIGALLEISIVKSEATRQATERTEGKVEDILARLPTRATLYGTSAAVAAAVAYLLVGFSR